MLGIDEHTLGWVLLGLAAIVLILAVNTRGMRRSSGLQQSARRDEIAQQNVRDAARRLAASLHVKSGASVAGLVDEQIDLQVAITDGMLIYSSANKNVLPGLDGLHGYSLQVTVGPENDPHQRVAGDVTLSYDRKHQWVWGPLPKVSIARLMHFRGPDRATTKVTA